MAGVVLRLDASVKDDGTMDFNTSPDHRYSFSEVRDAALKIHAELTWMLIDGPSKCPFVNHKGTQTQERS